MLKDWDSSTGFTSTIPGVGIYFFLPQTAHYNSEQVCSSGIISELYFRGARIESQLALNSS
jgi:hypothetical protein